MDPYSPHYPEAVGTVAIVQEWEALTFLHWPLDPAAVAALLPRGLTPDVFDGRAWVGLVPFDMRVHAGPFRPVPYLTVFPETNVRTYVRGPNGRPGVFFLSLDIPRLPAVVLARAGYNVPYMWSRMTVEQHGSAVEYTCHRRWGGPLATSTVRVRPGSAIPPADLGPRDHWLTARWGLWTSWYRRLAFVPLQHDPWPLAHASVDQLDDTLVSAAGLPQPVGDPLVHYSPRLRARLGLPHFI